MSRFPFAQNLKDALIAKLGGTAASDLASVDHRRQIAEARTAEPISHVTVADSGYTEATENPTPIPQVEDSEAYRQAVEMQEEVFRGYTLENTPVAYIDDRYDYGTEEGDAPIVEDAGIEDMERRLDEFLLAHPELERTEKFARDYPRLRAQAVEQAQEGQEL